MCVCVCLFVRAEPVLARIKEDHRRIILPSIDNIKHDTFEVERYENSGHGYNWELWCMYINPPKQWWDEGDMSAPIRQDDLHLHKCTQSADEDLAKMIFVYICEYGHLQFLRPIPELFRRSRLFYTSKDFWKVLLG